MFEKIQHIGYLTPDLDRAIAWFEESFNAVKAGGGPLNPGYAMRRLNCWSPWTRLVFPVKS